MKRSPNDRLLRELLTADGAPDLRRVSLERGLAAMQRRQQHRHLRRMILCVGLPVALAVGFLLKPTFTSARRTRLAASRNVPALAVRTVAPPIEIITEAELLALFPDRPVALIGKPGGQRLLVFEKPGRAGILRPPGGGWR